MIFILIGWLFFRANSFVEAIGLLAQVGNWVTPIWFLSFWISLAIFAVPLFVIDLWLWKSGDLLAPLKLSTMKLAALEGLLLWAIIFYWEKPKTPFIYFQF